MLPVGSRGGRGPGGQIGKKDDNDPMDVVGSWTPTCFPFKTYLNSFQPSWDGVGHQLLCCWAPVWRVPKWTESMSTLQIDE